MMIFSPRAKHTKWFGGNYRVLISREAFISPEKIQSMSYTEGIGIDIRHLSMQNHFEVSTASSYLWNREWVKGSPWHLSRINSQ